MNKSTPPPDDTSVRVGITLDQDEKRRLDAAARRSFVAPATFARMVVLASLNEEAPAARIRDHEPA